MCWSASPFYTTGVSWYMSSVLLENPFSEELAALLWFSHSIDSYLTTDPQQRQMCCTAGNGFIIALLSEAGSSEPRIVSLPVTVNGSSSSGKLRCSLKRQLIPFRHAVFCVLWSPVQTLLNNYLNCVHYDCSVQSWDEFAKVTFVDCVLWPSAKWLQFIAMKLMRTQAWN